MADKMAMMRMQSAAREAQVKLAISNFAEIKLPFIAAKNIDGKLIPVHLYERINHEYYNKTKNISGNIYLNKWIENHKIRSVRLFGFREIDL